MMLNLMGMLQQQQQQHGYFHSQMLLQANYSRRPGFYPPPHHPAPNPGLGGIQPPVHPAFTNSAGTSMLLRPRPSYSQRGSTSLAPLHPAYLWTGRTPFVQPPTSQGDAYCYSILPSEQQPSDKDES